MTITDSTPKPRVVDREEWERARADLLAAEKEETRVKDRVSAARRRLPMVEVGDYTFIGPDGTISLVELFGGAHQLIVQHFMFDPDWDAGCPSCSSLADSVGPLAHLRAHDIAFARISRAPIGKLTAYNDRMGWEPIWVSSADSTFNRDFGWTDDRGDIPGITVYLRDGDHVYQSYSTTGRGVEPLSAFSGYLAITPYGRQEDWEDSPDGWPQEAPGSGLRRHDEYRDLEH